MCTMTEPSGSMVIARIAAGAGFWQRARTLLMAQREIDIGHVGGRSLDRAGDPDAEHAAIAPGGFLLGAQRVVTDLPQRERKAGPGNRRCRATTPPGDWYGNSSARTRLRRRSSAGSMPKRRGRAVHQTLQRKEELRPAETAIEPARHLVGDHDLIIDREIAHAIRTAQGRMHAVKRRRIGRAQIGADILDLLAGAARAARRRPRMRPPWW